MDDAVADLSVNTLVLDRPRDKEVRRVNRREEQRQTQMQKIRFLSPRQRVAAIVPPLGAVVLGSLCGEETTAWVAEPWRHQEHMKPRPAEGSRRAGGEGQDWGCSTRNMDSTVKEQLARDVDEVLIGPSSHRLRRTALLNA